MLWFNSLGHCQFIATVNTQDFVVHSPQHQNTIDVFWFLLDVYLQAFCHKTVLET